MLRPHTLGRKQQDLVPPLKPSIKSMAIKNIRIRFTQNELQEKGTGETGNSRIYFARTLVVFSLLFAKDDTRIYYQQVTTRFRGILEFEKYCEKEKYTSFEVCTVFLIWGSFGKNRHLLEIPSSLEQRKLL